MLPHVRGRGGGGAAERRDPASEVRGSGQEKLPHAPNARGQGWRMGGATHAQDQGRRGEELPVTLVLDGAPVATGALSLALKHKVTISSPSGCG